MIPSMGCSCTNLKSAKNELRIKPHAVHIMKEENIQYVTCAHCDARVRLEEAVDYKHNLVYGEHFHCRDCDPEGVWDCVSHHVDMDVH